MASHAKNVLYQDGRLALVIVQTDSHGNPNSISYWKRSPHEQTKQYEGTYMVGALLDILT